MMKVIYYSLLFLTLHITTAFATSPLFTVQTDLENLTDQFPWINTETVVTGEGSTGTRYSQTDSVHPYGFGYKGSFPTVCQNKNLHIRFTEQLRVNAPGKDFGMVVSVSIGDSVIYWNYKENSKRMTSAGSWTYMEDDITIPGSITGANYIFSLYLWNKDGMSNADLDDFKIRFEEYQLPSFMPVSNIPKVEEVYDRKVTTKTAIFLMNKKEGGIKILNKEGDTLISSVSFINEWLSGKKDKHEQDWTTKWTLKKDSVSNDQHSLYFFSSDEISENTLIITSGTGNVIHFSVTTVFKKDVKIARSALALNYMWETRSVFTKNGLTDSINFSKEYWLGQEGLTISNGKSEFIIYHPENVSSIQLDTDGKMIMMNADYYADHPMLHFPIKDKSYGIYEDYSTSLYKKRDKVESSFNIHLVKPSVKLPKLLSTPYGTLASFVWTEHADYTDMRTQRAVYYGSEKIHRPDSATGGFIRYSMPVTKSIFYSNPQPVKNSDKAGFISTPEVTYILYAD
jgi:hypothetical protein